MGSLLRIIDTKKLLKKMKSNKESSNVEEVKKDKVKALKKNDKASKSPFDSISFYKFL